MVHAQNKSGTEQENLNETFKFNHAISEITGKITSGMTPQEAGKLDPHYLERLYAQAYHLYNTGKYLDAMHLFRTLIIMNSMEPKYVLGLAACHHLLKEYEQAIKVYTVCSILQPNDPLSFYHCSDCYIQMKDYLSALVTLEMTLKIAGKREEFSKIKERAQLSLAGVKEELNKKEDPSLQSDNQSKNKTE